MLPLGFDRHDQDHDLAARRIPEEGRSCRQGSGRFARRTNPGGTPDMAVRGSCEAALLDAGLGAPEGPRRAVGGPVELHIPKEIAIAGIHRRSLDSEKCCQMSGICARLERNETPALTHE